MILARATDTKSGSVVDLLRVIYANMNDDELTNVCAYLLANAWVSMFIHAWIHMLRFSLLSNYFFLLVLSFSRIILFSGIVYISSVSKPMHLGEIRWELVWA